MNKRKYMYKRGSLLFFRRFVFGEYKTVQIFEPLLFYLRARYVIFIRTF